MREYVYWNNYSDEEILNKLKEKIKELGYIPNVEEIDKIDQLPSSGVFYRRFKSFNNAIELCGFKPKRNHKIKTDDELINDLIALSKELDKTPTYRDINNKKDMTFSKTYVSRFGSLYNAYDIAGLPYVVSNRFRTDEEIINIWYEIKNDLNIIPLFEDLKLDGRKIHTSITWRWDNYYNFLKFIGEDTNHNVFGMKIYETEKGTKCLSSFEYTITKWLEDNHIDYDKEVRYSKVIPSDKTYRRFDWVITHNNITYYIEMFGMENNKEYKLKTKEKIKTCKENNINLIEIYPKDMKNKNIEEIFAFLLN